uniref:Phosphatidylcholine-sterol acyltransferase n=1 Tax=Anthurium amnicola TaxID=1678845 RepID=A0A1D1YWI0_9ARAE
MAQDDGSTYEGDASQLMTSIATFNEAASYLSQTTSYFTRCFTGTVEEQSPRETSMREQELVTFSSEEAGGSLSNDYSSSWKLPSLFGYSSDPCTAPSTSRSDGASSSASTPQDKDQRVNSTPVRNGISIFQSLITRARKTVRGSADDIGWLQCATDLPPVEDGTKRFQELLEKIRKNEHKLPNSVVYLLVPGLFSNHGPLYFVNTKTVFSKMGLACHIAKIHSEASVEKNAREIKDYIEEIYWGANKRVLLLGHSKGGVDAAAALSLYWSDLKDKVAGLVLAQSPYGGSPIASDILREGQLGDYVNLRKVMEFLISKVLKGDLQALEDLTYERRKGFLGRHPLPPELPVVSFHTEASIAPGVLASFSHVAHAELPVVSPLADGRAAKLPVVMPLAAAMAACAQLLQMRYGEKSDGLVTRRDAEVPGSVVVRPDRKLDHAWMVYSSLSDSPCEADASQVCEALLMLLVETSQKRRHEISMKEE